MLKKQKTIFSTKILRFKNVCDRLVFEKINKRKKS